VYLSLGKSTPSFPLGRTAGFVSRDGKRSLCIFPWQSPPLHFSLVTKGLSASWESKNSPSTASFSFGQTAGFVSRDGKRSLCIFPWQSLPLHFSLVTKGLSASRESKNSP